MELIEGIVVRTLKYQETSKIAHVLTNNGLESFLVRGANKMKSKNFAYSQPLTLVSFNFERSKKNSDMKIMTSGVVLNNYTNIKLNDKKLYSSMTIMEYIIQFTEHISDKVLLYNFVKNIFALINNNDENIFEQIFKLKLLYLIGVGPVFTKCIECGKKDSLVGFDFSSGGMKCRNCTTNNEQFYNKVVIDYVRKLYLIKLNNLDFIKEIYIDDKKIIEEVDRFINAYYQTYLGFNSSTSKVFKYVNVT